jgi:hypothetical protein
MKLLYKFQGYTCDKGKGGCVSQSFHCCDQIPDKNNLREEEFILCMVSEGSDLVLGSVHSGPIVRQNIMGVGARSRGYTSWLTGRREGKEGKRRGEKKEKIQLPRIYP